MYRTVRYLTKLDKVSGLSDEEREKLKQVEEKFPFRANEYYLDLIDWSDPDDPIRKIIIPQTEELDEWGSLDPSNESRYTVVHGLEHKYRDTAVILTTEFCGSYCRFCFRKRLFMHLKHDEIARDITPDLDYIEEHKEITNVLLTGGDPLALSTRNLETLIGNLRAMDHIRIIRIGTKIPAFNPYRILSDPHLLEVISKFSRPRRRIYIVTQFNHPREITEVAIEAVNLLIKAGAILVNQTPILRGINDNPDTLRELFKKLSFIGISPYYAFQCRPTVGNKPFSVPIVESYWLFERAKQGISGLAKRARLAMSHATGKVEILAVTEDNIILRYHRSPEPEDRGRVVVFKKNPDAYWLDQLGEPLEVVTP